MEVVSSDRGVLRNSDGEDIIARHGLEHAMTRDRLTRAMMQEIRVEEARLRSLLSGGKKDIETLRRSMKELMWTKAGIPRNGGDLADALGRIQGLQADVPALRVRNFKAMIKSLELQNMLRLAEMLCLAAILRTESRGSHFRSDYPREDNTNWLINIIITRQDCGMHLEAVPASLDIISPESIATQQ